ncbi:Lsr2 protein [Streptomyces sp. KhCrAH-43]|nr:hypothetical protein [Streptomyces sp. SID4920]MYX66975.1 hypothetical protein [Streptomyces sp. SID8373]RAJ68472.1 Lsr2 protein [Streptomyces sp. KhCrAH-43]
MDEQQQAADARAQRDDAVRAWARDNGYLVNDQGRIPAAIREAYAKKQPRAAD